MTAIRPQGPLSALAPHQLESGLVTEREIDRVRRWTRAVAHEENDALPEPAWLDDWLGTGIPFSFEYGGGVFAERSRSWDRQVTPGEAPAAQMIELRRNDQGEE